MRESPLKKIGGLLRIKKKIWREGDCDSRNERIPGQDKNCRPIWENREWQIQRVTWGRRQGHESFRSWKRGNFGEGGGGVRGGYERGGREEGGS